MIGKIKYECGRNYICDDCNAMERFTSYKTAIAAGWAISRGRQQCYCPKCAPFRRNVGRSGARRNSVQENLNGELRGRA